LIPQIFLRNWLGIHPRCERSALLSPIQPLKDATHLVYPLMVSEEKIVIWPFTNQIISTTC
jgi:hypothetical protein